MASADTARLIAVLELKDQFTSKINNAEKALGKFESRSTKAGRQIGLGILRGAAVATAGVAAFGGIFAKGLSAASDLNETVSKTGVVFGKSAKDVLAFGRDSAASLGLSENAALSAAAQYGNLFVSLGLVPEKASKMSIAMVKLAGDLASFNNASPEDTLLAIQAGLVGETEPLRKYGINLNDATLRQEAMALGLVKTTKEVLPPAIKAQASYSLILKQSGTAQGDFARTSGGLANQLRILKANATDMLATLAAPALPQVAKIFQRINTEVKANQPEIEKLGKAVAGLFSDANIEQGVQIIKSGIGTAKEAAPIIAQSAKVTFELVKGAVGLFRSLPPELQKLAVAGFAVNKLTGGLVTNIAGGIIDTVGKNFLQRGGSPANPLFVADVAGGIGKGGLPGAAAKSTVGKVVSAATKVFMVGAAIGVFAELKGILDDQARGNREGAANLDTQTKDFTGGATLADLRKSLTGVDAQIAALTSGLTPEAIAFQLDIDGVKTAVDKSRADLVAAIAKQGGATSALDIVGRLKEGFNASKIAVLAKINGDKAALDARRIEAAENRTGTIVGASGVKLAGTISVLGAQFGKDIRGLKAATKPVDIAKFAKAIAASVSKGSGSVAGTKGVIKDLKIKLAETHDPKLQAVLKAAIHTVEAKLPNRQKVDAQISEAKKIVKSTDSTSKRIADLKTIEAALRRDGNTHAASQVRKMEASIIATKKVSADTRSEGAGIRRAVNEKDLSVKVTVPITNNLAVTNGAITKTQTTFGLISGVKKTLT